jgi:hypothetical protein
MPAQHLFVETAVGSLVTIDDVPVVCSAADWDEPIANVAAVVTYAGVAGLRHVISGIAWSYHGGVPTTGRLLIADGAATVFALPISDEGCGFIIFPKPKIGAAPLTNMVVTLTASGVAGVFGVVNVLNHWQEV